VPIPKLAHGNPKTPPGTLYYIHTQGNTPMTKATQRPSTQSRYTSQVARDRKAAALQRAEERRLTGSCGVDQVNRLYTVTL
jgi:hypothetical protein